MTAAASGAEVIKVDFRKAEPAPGAPDPADSPLDYHDGDPVPDGWRVHDPEPGRPDGHKFLLYNWPYEQTVLGRLERLEDMLRRNGARLSALERGAR